MSFSLLRLVGFILGLFLVTLAASMLIPMLTLALFQRYDDFDASGRACSPRLPASRWSCRDGRLTCISCPAHVFPDHRQLGGGLRPPRCRW